MKSKQYLLAALLSFITISSSAKTLRLKTICFIAQETIDNVDDIAKIEKFKKVEYDYKQKHPLTAASWMRPYRFWGVEFDFYNFSRTNESMNLISKAAEMEPCGLHGYVDKIKTNVHFMYIIYAIPRERSDVKKMINMRAAGSLLELVKITYFISLPIQVFFFFIYYKIVPRKSSKKKMKIDKDLKRFLQPEEDKTVKTVKKG